MEPSENTLETTEAGADVDSIKTLGELLAQDDSALSSGDDDEGKAVGDDNENAKPVKFNDLAGANDLELDDLYKLTVTLDDGKEMSIEALKDLGHTQDELALREVEWAEKKAEQEQKLTRAQNELAELAQALPEGSINPDVLAKIRGRNEERVVQERQRTLEAIPEWADEQTRTKDLVGMVDYLEGFGFPKDHLANVVDHRMFKLIRDGYQREQRIKAALAKVTSKPEPAGSTTVVGKSPSKTADTSRPRTAQTSLEAFFQDV